MYIAKAPSHPSPSVTSFLMPPFRNSLHLHTYFFTYVFLIPSYYTDGSILYTLGTVYTGLHFPHLTTEVGDQFILA